jgi:hypothetical protein
VEAGKNIKIVAVEMLNYCVFTRNLYCVFYLRQSVIDCRFFIYKQDKAYLVYKN